jgi:long-chain acyl-CoA synthetase
VTFLEAIFARLQASAGRAVLCEIRDGRAVSVTGGELLGLVQRVRGFLAARGLERGDRCALIAPNSVRWAAIDLAMMAEGIIVVPLYARQPPAELAGMMKDSTPAEIFCSDASMAAGIQSQWDAAPPITLLDTVFSGEGDTSSAGPVRHTDSEAVTIIYTSGTSGEPKGVVLNAGNLKHILGCTHAGLDQLMGPRREPDRIFHYAPFCFAASSILLLTALSRNSVLALSMDLSRLSDDLKLARPDYFLNVPALLERVRARIEETVRARGGLAAQVFSRAQRAYLARRNKEGALLDVLCLYVANAVMFGTIRNSIGPTLKALICGSAPLAVETQLFFMMLGIAVLQVYGLTETTGICTMDDPRSIEPGRVGGAISGVEMTLGENGEILVRGPNVFAGYWQRPDETARALDGGWLHTGDQGEVDARGSWRITGRLKNLIILSSGHNIAPEPLEQALLAGLPEAEQVVLLGNQRSFLAALVTARAKGGFDHGRIPSAIEALNHGLPHYKRVRAFHVVPEPFTIENGLLTTNGKLKREAIAARFASAIEQLYQKKSA